jgi:hypothetical protein
VNAQTAKALAELGRAAARHVGIPDDVVITMEILPDRDYKWCDLCDPNFAQVTEDELQKIEYKSTEFVRTDDAGRFCFEGCGCEGALNVPEEVQRLTCGGCGALYVLWKNPEPTLMCVVKPMIDERGR